MQHLDTSTVESTQQKDNSRHTILGLEILLKRLDPDPHQAGEKYCQLLSALAFFIERVLGCSIDSEDIAREVLDIIATRLGSDKDIQNLQAYSFGVARNVLSAHQRKNMRVLEDNLLAVRDEQQR